MENNIIKEIRFYGIILIAFLAVCTVLIILSINTRFNKLEKLLLNDSIQVSYNLPNNFKYAYNILKGYNKHIDTNTVIKITETANKFNLTDNKQIFKMALGQLLIESGAKHLSYKTSKILTSETGALGISQILPNSAYGYLIKYCKVTDKAILKQLGCSDMSFVFNNKLTKSDRIKKIKGWLHNETNNIALWGFIMRKNLDLTHDVNKALISYSDGIGGMRNYIDSGGNIKHHDYIVGINNKLNK